MSKVEPQVMEVNVNYNAGGKVALEEYGAESYGYGASVSRKYAVPADWTEQEIKDFELTQILDIRQNIDPLLQEERDALMAARKY